MKRILIIIGICQILGLGKTFGQGNFEVELREGFLFYDIFKDPNDIRNTFQGYGVQSDIGLIYRYTISKPVELEFGLGYSNFYLLEPRSILDNGTLSSSYFSFRYGIAFNISKRLQMVSNLNNFLLLHREKQGFAQRRMFTNLELGFGCDISDRWKLYATTPLSIYPMHFSDSYGLVTPTGSIILNSYVELIGINIGLRYVIN